MAKNVEDYRITIKRQSDFVHGNACLPLFATDLLLMGAGLSRKGHLLESG